MELSTAEEVASVEETTVPIPAGYPLAKVILAEFCLEEGVEDIFEILNLDEVFNQVASVGDLATMRELAAYIRLFPDQEESQGTHIGSIYNAARFGHWPMVQLLLDLYYDKKYDQSELTLVSDGAILGGHIHILTNALTDRRISFLLTSPDPDAIRDCVIYRRHDILNLYLEVSSSDTLSHDLETVIYYSFTFMNLEALQIAYNYVVDRSAFLTGAEERLRQTKKFWSRPNKGPIASRATFSYQDLIRTTEAFEKQLAEWRVLDPYITQTC